MQSHVMFVADCQLKQLERREKQNSKNDEPGETYWTVKDNLGVSYLVYKSQKRLIPYLEKLIPSDGKVSIPVRLEGYISEPQFRKFYCLLRVFTWDSTDETYRIFCDAMKPGLYPEQMDIFPENPSAVQGSDGATNDVPSGDPEGAPRGESEVRP